MASWWEILGVERDADLRSVKRAYAVKLKTIRPDEKPDEFMELRAAYETALAELRGEHVSTYNLDSDIMRREVSSQTDIEAVAHDEPSSADEYLADTILKNIRDGVETGGQLHNKAFWKEALDDPALDSIDVFPRFQILLFSWLAEMQGFFDRRRPLKFNRDIGVLIFRKMGWLSGSQGVLMPYFTLQQEAQLGEKVGLRINYGKLGFERPKTTMRALFTFENIFFFCLFAIILSMGGFFLKEGSQLDKITYVAVLVAYTAIIADALYEAVTNPNENVIGHYKIYYIWKIVLGALYFTSVAGGLYFLWTAFA